MSEKGRCDVCAAPCSSCMHFDQHMEFSGDTSVLSTATAAKDDADDSDIDVKVCDICGDAGREDMLAICTRCTDGAEHTYCMRKMLKKVPSANWLCEDCKYGQPEVPKRPAKRAPENDPPSKRLSRDSSFNQTWRSHTNNATLLKSKSFNASNPNPKPKLKLVDEVLPLKPKEITRVLHKSMSLKSAPDSKLKMLSPRASHILDSKGSRSLKDRHFDRKTSEPTPRSVSALSGNSKSKATPKLAGEPKLKEEACSSSEKPSNSGNVDGTRSRSTSSKSTFCQKCKEIGHSAEFCGAETAAKSVREESKLKDAIQKALLKKPEIQRMKRSEESCAEQEQANKSKLWLGAVNHGLRMLAIPEYDYSWRGWFEMSRSGGGRTVCGGVQAHMSSCVSARVPEVVRRFPHKLWLEQVPRLAAWPTHFHAAGPKEDNIALYFFAKDLDSYDRHYKSLLDGMIKSDLALKGNFEGVELLIFPSNQLPENSQRWNMLYFLWGVFRARRVHSSETESTTKSNVANERAVAVDAGCEEDRDEPKKSEALLSGTVTKDEIKCESDVNLRCDVRGKSPPLECVESKTKECLLVEKKSVWCEEKVIAEDPGNGAPAEMRLFPNLELALGAETKQSKGVNLLPFLVGPGPKEDNEDEASLSLSLSFPTTRR